MHPELFQQMAELEGRHWWFVGRRRILAALVDELLATRTHSRILDVGCGTGANLAALAGAPGRSGLGIDPASPAIEIAKREYPELEFVCGLAPQDVTGGLTGFDLVTLLDVLEHVEDAAQLLARIVADLAVGAHVVLTVPADRRLWGPHDVSHGHLRRYDIDTFRALWRKLPVRERLVSFANSTMYPIVRILRTYSRHRGTALGHRDTDLFMPPRPLNALLAAIFSAERRRLCAALRRGSSASRPPYARGVSLLAALTVEDRR